MKVVDVEVVAGEITMMEMDWLIFGRPLQTGDGVRHQRGDAGGGTAPVRDAAGRARPLATVVADGRRPEPAAA